MGQQFARMLPLHMLSGIDAVSNTVNMLNFRYMKARLKGVLQETAWAILLQALRAMYQWKINMDHTISKMSMHISDGQHFRRTKMRTFWERDLQMSYFILWFFAHMNLTYIHAWMFYTYLVLLNGTWPCATVQCSVTICIGVFVYCQHCIIFLDLIK